MPPIYPNAVGRHIAPMCPAALDVEHHGSRPLLYDLSTLLIAGL